MLVSCSLEERRATIPPMRIDIVAIDEEYLHHLFMPVLGLADHDRN